MHTQMECLQAINGPEDVRKLPREALPLLAEQVRRTLIAKLSRVGGHVGSNLGVVELTVALHYVFESPRDKIIWDVSHQCYAHKMLTGRKAAFLDPAHYRDVTGFTNVLESEHDFFTIGHTATSISLALGLAKGRDGHGGKENIIAVIGDGALGGGEAYEGLNYAGEYGKNLIIVLNDNDQSVAENHGGLYRKLRELRCSGGTAPDNPFRALGLDYRYLEAGNDVLALVDALESIRGTSHPVVLHIHTIKGKGLPFAETDREEWHSGSPFHPEDGTPRNGYPVYDTTIHDSLARLMAENPTAVVLTAGTPRALGFVGQDRRAWAETGRFVDVGIAEEHAAAMASGVAGYGSTGVFGVYAPFMQRAYDQISHDLCLNNNPATLLVLLPGVYGMKSSTHLGLCDIQMLAHIPNLVYLSPAYKEEYLQMFRYATSQKEHPVAIRVPVRLTACGAEDTTDYSLLNRARVHTRGKDVALMAVGSLIPMAMEIAKVCEEKTGKKITVINPCYLTGVDEALMEELQKDHGFVITMEDGEKDGGWGQRIASYFGETSMRVKNLGISKAFHNDFSAEGLLAENGISVEQILNDIEKYHQQKGE